MAYGWTHLGEAHGPSEHSSGELETLPDVVFLGQGLTALAGPGPWASEGTLAGLGRDSHGCWHPQGHDKSD